MRVVLWVLLAFALAAALAIVLRANDGYALFVFPPWRIEISLNFFAALLAGAFVVSYAAIRVVSHMLTLPSYVREFRRRQREKKGSDALIGAIQSLYEGRYARTEKLAAQASEANCSPSLANLVGARAAQRRREFDSRDAWLDRPAEDAVSWRLARVMTRAEMLIEERRFDEARALLRELHASGPRHIATLMLLLRAEQGLEHWEEVIRLAKLLEKSRAMPPEAIDGMRFNARLSLLSGASHDAVELTRVWREIPESERAQPRIAVAAARAFLRLNDARSARAIVEAALDREWNDALILLYAEGAGEDTVERVARAEAWLRLNPRDAALLLTLGHLCLRLELWGKAQSYLEASLNIQVTQAAHWALAELFDHVGRAEEANRHYRAGANMGLSI